MSNNKNTAKTEVDEGTEVSVTKMSKNTEIVLETVVSQCTSCGKKVCVGLINPPFPECKIYGTCFDCYARHISKGSDTPSIVERYSE